MTVNIFESIHDTKPYTTSLEKVIEINPASPVVSATLATTYVKQFKIFDTIKEMRRIKIYSLDFLMYAQEVRLEEDEMMDDGYMDEYERLSVSEMRRSYAEYLRDLASY